MKLTLASMVLLSGLAVQAHAQAQVKAKAHAKERPADDKAAADQPPKEAPFKPQTGPQKVELGHELVLDLPADFLFLDQPQARRLMEKNGNLWNDNLLGVVAKADADWLVTIRYTEDGYVKDDDAEKIDADDLLKDIREGTEEANTERKEKGFQALHVLGWSDPPRYQRDAHHLVWGIRAKGEDDPADGINFNTRVLGRKGFVALNLIDAASSIEASKPAVATLLAATTYKPGARYQDFDGKTDKVAEYGLAALVLGGAGVGALKLVKIGLLAKFGGKILALLIAFKKAFVLLLVGAGAFLKKLFTGKKAPPPAFGATGALENAPPPEPAPTADVAPTGGDREPPAGGIGGV